MLFSSAIARDPLTGEWAPDLAERYSQSSDGRTYDITLNPDLRWSDGTPLTVDDVLFSYDVYLDSEFGLTASEWREELGAVTVERTGARSYRISAENPTIQFQTLAALSPIPRHIVAPWLAEHGARDLPGLWSPYSDLSSHVSSGPFVLERYEESDGAYFAPNPHYHERDDSGQQLPYLNEVILRAAFGPDGGGLPDPHHSWFADRRFRAAVAALVDRERLASIAYFGTSSPRVGFASPHSPYASGVTPGSAYDPGEATRLLEEMGLRDRDDDGIRDDAGGNAVTVTMLVQDNNVRRARAAAIIGDEMRRVGLDASVQAVPYEQIVRTLTTTYEHQMVFLGFTGSGDLVDSGNVIRSSAPLHISYPSQETPHYEWERELDALYEELLATAREPEIKEICSRIESVFLEELPWIYLVSQHAFAAAREPYGNLVRRTIGSGTFVVGRLFVR